MKAEDTKRLRELAKKVAEIAADPVQEKNRKNWIAMNDLKKVRPLVHVRDYPYFLLEYKDEMQTTIEDPFLKDVEQILLLRIYEWNHVRGDRVIEPFIECPVAFTDSEFGLSGFEFALGNVAKEFYDKAKHYESVIKTPDDIEKIKIPVVEYDEKTTMERLNLLSEIFHGIMPVKLFGRSHFRCTPMDDIITWTGIDNAMINMAIEPEFMHALLDRYMEAQMTRIKQYEKLGILSSNNYFKDIGNNCPGYTSQLPPPTESGIGAKIGDIWGENADQIMTSVSPEMTQEFSFEHEKVWAKQFKLHSYGCCERLDNKFDMLVEAFPNLRKVTSSPYSNLDIAAEKLGSRYVISFKPNSTYLVGGSPQYDLLKDEFVHACKLVEKYNLNLVFNMKTIVTLDGEPQRLWKWCDMAMELLQAHFGE
ncbi:MAG: hypothetical protein FWG66_02795 [Spirochaetes bacterium]|nr:hypothetical protein [Spirochaetota bacterium]